MFCQLRSQQGRSRALGRTLRPVSNTPDSGEVRCPGAWGNWEKRLAKLDKFTIHSEIDGGFIWKLCGVKMGIQKDDVLGIWLRERRKEWWTRHGKKNDENLGEMVTFFCHGGLFTSNWSTGWGVSFSPPARWWLLDFITSSSASCPPPRPPPPLVSPRPCLHQLPPPLLPCQLFAKLFANSLRRLSAPSSLPTSQLSVHRWTSTWDLPSSVCTAGPHNLGPAQLSVHRWTSTGDLPSSVCTAGPQPGTCPAQCAPLDLNLGPAQLSVHRWTSTWDLPSSVCTAGPQRPDRMPEEMPDRMSDRMPEDMPDKMPWDMPDRMS